MGPGGRRRRVCKQVTVTHTASFDALFSAWPKGLALQPGDSIDFLAQEAQTVAPPFLAHYHAVVIRWADRAPARLYSLAP